MTQTKDLKKMMILLTSSIANIGRTAKIQTKNEAQNLFLEEKKDFHLEKLSIQTT